jgi:hypothetical protein
MVAWQAEEIKSDTALLKFVETLQKAHDAAVTVERERDASRKCPRHYTGNSKRSGCHHAAHRRDLAKKGCRFMTSFFSKVTKESGNATNQEIIGIVSDSDESEQEAQAAVSIFYLMQ